MNYALPWTQNPIEELITFFKGGGGGPPPPAPPAPPPSAKQVEVRAQERDARRNRLKRYGQKDTILAGDALGETSERKTLLGG